LSCGIDCHPQELYPIELWAAHGRSTSRRGGQGQVEVVSTLERGAEDRTTHREKSQGREGARERRRAMMRGIMLI